MTDAKQPAHFDWATELSDAQGHVTLSEQEAHEIGARLRASHGQAPAQPDPAYSEACNLATALFKKHFAHLPDYASGQVVWSLCDSTAGVISQIDNMVSGLVQPPTASPQADSVQEDAAREPLQIFDSPRAKAMMRAFEEGWAACRDAEFVGEDAQNDAFNQSATVNVCMAEDWTAAVERASHGQAPAQADEYPALVCDYCGALTPDPWHSSGMLHGKMSKHIHSCDACCRGAAQEGKSNDR